MPVMHNRVSLKYALEGRGMRTKEVFSVHQVAVHLVLEKGHQNARENHPATRPTSFFGDVLRPSPFRVLAAHGTPPCRRRSLREPHSLAYGGYSPPERWRRG